MATKDRWITAQEAAAILSSNTDHEVSADYVRMLAKGDKPKIRFRAKDGRTNEYSKASVEAYRVRLKHAPRVRPRPSTRRQEVTIERVKEETAA